MGTLLTEITRPADCLLAIALPVSEQAIMHDISLGDEKDFARHLLRSTGAQDAADLWHNRGYGAFMTRFTQNLLELQSLGITVMPIFKLSDLRDICMPDKPAYRVVTLFAHWSNGCNRVELSDGLHAAETVATSIHPDYKGIFDLTVCHSVEMQKAIKSVRPGCIVMANERTANLQFRAVFYKNLIKLLAIKPLNYLDAYTELRLMLA